MFIFIPIPLFYDFGKFSFVIIDVKEYYLFNYETVIPMPIGAIALSFAIAIGYICSIAYSSFFRSIFSPAQLVKFYLFVVTPIAIYALVISELSFPRLIQLLLPMVFISLLSFPVLLKDRLDLLRNTLLSAFVVFNLHFFSVIFTSENFLKVSDRYEFASFYGKLVYQSLIAYPAVLTLYLFLSVVMIYVSRKDIFPSFRKYRFFSYYFIGVLLYMLAASGRRAFLVEYVSSLIIIVSLSLLYIFSNRFVKRATAWYLFLYLSVFISFFIFYINSPLSDRVVSSIESNTFDSGRIGILIYAYDFFTNNLSIFFFGGGDREAPGLHNYILDQIYRVGIVGLLTIYITMGLLIKRFVKTHDLGTAYVYQRRMFLLILFSSLFLQSMINASVSQPYYFVNFLIVTVFVYFVLFTQNKNKLKS